MSEWIDPLSPPLLRSATPWLILSNDLKDLRTAVEKEGRLVEIDIGDAENSADIVEALKSVLPFPPWCGSNWDAVDDAFAEIRDGLSFPFFVVAYGLRELLDRDVHLALKSVVRLDGLSGYFSRAGDQFEVVYAAEQWPIQPSGNQ